MKAGDKAKEAKEDGGETKKAEKAIEKAEAATKVVETKKAEAAIEKAAKASATNWNTLRVLSHRSFNENEIKRLLIVWEEISNLVWAKYEHHIKLRVVTSAYSLKTNGACTGLVEVWLSFIIDNFKIFDTFGDDTPSSKSDLLKFGEEKMFHLDLSDSMIQKSTLAHQQI